MPSADVSSQQPVANRARSRAADTGATPAVPAGRPAASAPGDAIGRFRHGVRFAGQHGGKLIVAMSGLTLPPLRAAEAVIRALDRVPGMAAIAISPHRQPASIEVSGP